MAADNHWSGRITITPPLAWQELKVTIAVEDVRIMQHEEDGLSGRVITGVAVVPARARDSWSAHTAQELQALIDQHPKHEFTGSLRVDYAPVCGDDACLAERWTVIERTVVHETAGLAWRIGAALHASPGAPASPADSLIGCGELAWDVQQRNDDGSWSANRIDYEAHGWEPDVIAAEMATFLAERLGVSDELYYFGKTLRVRVWDAARGADTAKTALFGGADAGSEG